MSRHYEEQRRLRLKLHFTRRQNCSSKRHATLVRVFLVTPESEPTKAPSFGDGRNDGLTFSFLGKLLSLAGSVASRVQLLVSPEVPVHSDTKRTARATNACKPLRFRASPCVCSVADGISSVPGDSDSRCVSRCGRLLRQ